MERTREHPVFYRIEVRDPADTGGPWILRLLCNNELVNEQRFNEAAPHIDRVTGWLQGQLPRHERSIMQQLLNDVDGILTEMTRRR